MNESVNVSLCTSCFFPQFSSCTHEVLISSSFFIETEPLCVAENGLPNNDPSKDPTPSPRPLHNTPDYRAAKRERPYYPGHAQTPPPLRRVSSNPTEPGPVCAHRRVEGRINYTQSHRHTRFFFNHYTDKYSPRGFCFPFYFYCEPNFFLILFIFLQILRQISRPC